mmetsp:Transcript_77923/g.215384  ORF Transcript_77923/g.215384 Transcript_77923/m.215384 type:complete len:206 (-) Transcript_77923:1229-1846(-)
MPRPLRQCRHRGCGTSTDTQRQQVAFNPAPAGAAGGGRQLDELCASTRERARGEAFEEARGGLRAQGALLPEGGAHQEERPDVAGGATSVDHDEVRSCPHRPVLPALRSALRLDDGQSPQVGREETRGTGLGVSRALRVFCAHALRALPGSTTAGPAALAGRARGLRPAPVVGQVRDARLPVGGACGGLRGGGCSSLHQVPGGCR